MLHAVKAELAAAGVDPGPDAKKDGLVRSLVTVNVQKARNDETSLLSTWESDVKKMFDGMDAVEVVDAGAAGAAGSSADAAAGAAAAGGEWICVAKAAQTVSQQSFAWWKASQIASELTAVLMGSRSGLVTPQGTSPTEKPGSVSFIEFLVWLVPWPWLLCVCCGRRISALSGTCLHVSSSLF